MLGASFAHVQGSLQFQILASESQKNRESLPVREPRSVASFLALPAAALQPCSALARHPLGCTCGEEGEGQSYMRPCSVLWVVGTASLALARLADVLVLSHVACLLAVGGIPLWHTSRRGTMCACSCSKRACSFPGSL